MFKKIRDWFHFKQNAWKSLKKKNKNSAHHFSEPTKIQDLSGDYCNTCGKHRDECMCKI